MASLELVLRDGSNQFYPISTLLSVFCHEVSYESMMSFHPGAILLLNS